MNKIKYISFFKKDAVFDSERIAHDLLDVCEQIDFGKDDAICKIQVVQGELVHCKDCKYWEKEYDEYDGEEWWTCGKYEPYNSNDVMTEDDFCSRGEKKDE